MKLQELINNYTFKKVQPNITNKSSVQDIKTMMREALKHTFGELQQLTEDQIYKPQRFDYESFEWYQIRREFAKFIYKNDKDEIIKFMNPNKWELKLV